MTENFRVLAHRRLEEARILQAANLWSGAYYLAGYSVECALKACALRAMRRYHMPDKTLVTDLHIHDLQKLVKAAGLEAARNQFAAQKPGFETNWAVVRLWNETSRYETWTQQDAHDLIEAITQRGSGVFGWIKRALVDALAEDGFLLDSELRARGISLETPLIARDAETGEWALLFGVPDRISRRITYDEIQRAIKKIGLRLSLDQIVLVKAGDPGLRDLRSLSTPDRAGLSWSGPIPVDVAGRLFASPRSTRLSPRHYESAVGDAVRATLSTNGVLHEGRHADERLTELLDGGEVYPVFAIDLLLEAAGALTIIEAKATRRPLGSGQVLAPFGKLTVFQRSAPAGMRIGMVLVSAAGFTNAALSAFGRSVDFALVAWAIGGDPHMIRDALTRLGDA